MSFPKRLTAMPRYAQDVRMETDTARLSIGEAARLLGVSVDTVRRWESAGLIVSTRTPGNQRRFELAEIERARSAA